MVMRKEAKGFGMPWEDEYGYAQAVKVDGTIYVSAQLAAQLTEIKFIAKV
jgi:hypothetical protein